MASKGSTTPPSSATTGFFQEQPALHGAFQDDEVLKRIYKFYLPRDLQVSIEPDLVRFSNLVTTPQILQWNADAEHNPPYLRTWDAWGRRIDELVTSEGWRELQKLGIVEGIVAIGHAGAYGRHDRMYQFLKYHIWTPWAADVTCPSAMTDGAARLLKSQLEGARLSAEERRAFEAAYSRLVSRDPSKAWTSGQWMTERPGGSDVRNTETIAVASPSTSSFTDIDGLPTGPFSISGFKWFSSATDANSTVLLAKEPDGAISAFFAPTRRITEASTQPGLNGISIQRLKNKLGTRALPTAELVLSDLRAYRLGAPGQGTKEISTVLNITRVHNAVSAVASWGRGLAISRAFARVRRARGKLLKDTPAHVHTLAEQHVQYHAMMHLAFYTVSLLGAAEHHGSLKEDSRLAPRKAIPHLLRLCTPIAKALTAKAAIAGLQECMESLGGVGYLENDDISLNIARAFRGVNVLSIWEGTTNVMAEDLVRVVKGSGGDATLHALEQVVTAVLAHWTDCRRNDWREAVHDGWAELRQKIQQSNKEELILHGRDLAKDLGWLVCALLLGEDALSDASETVAEVATRWFATRKANLGRQSWKEAIRWDRRIVFGEEEVAKTSKL